MKKNSIFLVFVLLLSLSSVAKDAYNISITIKGAPETKFFLGYYFGDKQYLRDSAITDKNGKMVFKGNKALEGGVYLIATSEKALLFDFIVSEMFFSLETELNNIVPGMKIKNSSENDIFFQYTQFTHKIGKDAGNIEEDLKKAREANDTALTRKLTEQYRKINMDLYEYRQQVQSKHPNSLLAKIFKMMTEIQVPDAPRNEKGEIIDSNFQFNYYYNHYFDNMDLSDERIVRTPVFHGKFENFILKLTPQIPDSIIKSADFVLEKASGKENFKYMLFWITNHYETSSYMGMDKVFVHMVDQYYAKGKAFWIDETLLFKMKDRADQLRNNLIGLRGQNLTMLDTNHVYHSLYNVKANYTLLVFFDANCGKCKEEMPKLKKLYDELNAAKPAVSGKKYFDVFAVSLTPDAKEWQKYMREQKFKWLSVYDPNNETNFRKLYDIYSTPVIYLMDENKKIIAKRLNVEQVKEFIQDQEKKNNLK